VYTRLFKKAMEGDKDCGGLVNFNYYAGEPVTGLSEGRPMLLRTPDAGMNMANFMRAQIYASLETLKYGMDIMNQEQVTIDEVYGHGGLFKTEGVAQNLLAAAIHAPVTVMDTASEGGPWGEALLALYMLRRKDTETIGDLRVKDTGSLSDFRGKDAETLGDFLAKEIFADQSGTTVSPDPADVEGFETFTQRYKDGIAVEKAAVDAMKW
jgi:sugar (pentulose or hexulose) kinase